MKKFFLFTLLLAATSLFAVDPRVETFDTKDGTATSTYVTTVTTKECQQASWTFFSGGILKNLGDMGGSNFAAVIRAKKSTEDVYPYLQSSTIEGGIDSLWFTWNSNGNETGGTWNVKIYINEQQVGTVTGAGAPKAASPFNKFGIGKLNVSGDFTIKFVNESPYDGTSNFMRFVIDDLSWMPKPAAGEKTTPNIEYAEKSLIKKIDADPFTNVLTNGSDATPTFESSKPAVATVDAAGKVTIVGVGETTISASVAETDTYKAAEASYTLRVVPLNFNMETFDGANNVDLSTQNTYLTTPTESFNASTATGIKWTSLLGSVRDNLGGGSMPTANIAAAIRAKKNTEDNYGYLLSSTISGGIDSLAFDWTCNGNESSRQNPWNIKIYINDKEVSAITDACTAVPAKPYRFSVGNIKIDGNFTIKIVNNNVPDDGSSNQYRWVVDNIEWYSYEAPAPAHTYSLVGPLSPANWDEKSTAGDMTLKDGVYSFTVENVQLVAGTKYEYKIVEDHAWTVAFPQDGNATFTVEKSGKYNVTFTLNESTKAYAAVPELIEEAQIDPTAAIKGSWDEWAQEVALTLAADKKSASGVLNITAAADYEFKVVLNGSDWRANGYTYHREYTGAAGISGNGSNMKLTADVAGEYTITWTFANDSLGITFPKKDATGIDNTNADVKAVKVIENGQIFIIRNGEKFNAQGQVVR